MLYCKLKCICNIINANNTKEGEKEKMKTRKNKKGISLIVLVITIMIHYDEWIKASKIGKVPPKNKFETTKKIINIEKVVDFNVCYF